MKQHISSRVSQRAMLLLTVVSMLDSLLFLNQAEAFQPHSRVNSPTLYSADPTEATGVYVQPWNPLRLSADAVSESVITIQSLPQNKDFWVFVAGIFPFAWATIEFWRRIAVGESFGTGKDSIVIGMDDSPADSRGRRVLGKGALVTAVLLFAVAFGTIALVLVSVVTSGAPPEVMPSVTSASDEMAISLLK